jgi:prepilin-type N-terminal cleavage/methylation domain-containing protein
MNKIYNKNKGFTLIELLVVVAIIGILAAVGVVAYNGYTTSAKITATKQQHQTIKNFIKASYGLCALGNNYIVMKTCDNGSWSCKGLKVGSTPPGIVNRPCKYGAGSASNSSYHFAFHFNYSQMKNGWGLNGSTGSSVGGNMKDQCCMMRSGDPPLGRTHIWSSYPQPKIKVKTNIGDKDGNNIYVYGEIDWPYQGFKQ